MRKRAETYIKKRPVPNASESPEDSTSSQKTDAVQTQPENISSNQVEQKDEAEQPSITEDSEEDSSISSQEEKESRLHQIPPERSSMGAIPRKHPTNRPAPLELFRSLSSTSSSPKLDRSASYIGKPRTSIFDPSTLKRLKTIKLETLKQDDQIELAILILQKEFEDRNPTDLAFLIKCTENVGFFKKYDEETHRECMAKMYHVHLKQGDACINYGEFGENFWVTLKGKVGILVPIEKEITDKNGEVRKEKVLTRVAGQGAGYAFGELALLERKPRAATIICEDDCDFAVLDKAPFQHILQEKEEKRLFAEVNFLKSLKIFSQWSYAAIRSLFMYSHLKPVSFNQTVYRQSDPAEGMYIIRSGELKVSYKAHFEVEEEDPELEIVDKYFRKKPAYREVELAILGPGEIFGVEELINGKPRSHTVTCQSQTAVVLMINKKEARSLVLNESSAKNWLKKFLEAKSVVQSNRIDNINNKTKKFQPFLMRTESPPKVTKADQTTLIASEQTVQIPENLQYYRRSKSNSDKLNKPGVGVDFDAQKSRRLHKLTEIEEQREKEIHAKLASPKVWQSPEKISMQENSSPLGTESIPNTASTLRTPYKQGSAQLSLISSPTEEGEEPMRLSITSKGLQEYRDHLKLRRSDRKNRLSVEIQSKTDNPDESGPSSRGRHAKTLSILKLSPTASKLDRVSTASSVERFASTHAQFSLKLQQMHHSISESLPFFNKSPSKSTRLSTNPDIVLSEQQMKNRKEIMDKLSNIETRLNIRDKINQDVFLFSKRGTRGQPCASQSFYNRGIISAVHQSRSENSPISLRIREKLNQMQKNSGAENDLKSEQLTSSIERVKTEGYSPRAQSPMSTIRGTLTSLVRVPSEEQRLRKIANKFRATNGSPLSMRPKTQSGRVLKAKTEAEMPIIVTESIFPVIECKAIGHEGSQADLSRRLKTTN